MAFKYNVSRTLLTCSRSTNIRIWSWVIRSTIFRLSRISSTSIWATFSPMSPWHQKNRRKILNEYRKFSKTTVPIAFTFRRFRTPLVCDHITQVLRLLHWLPVRQRVDFKVATLVHRSLSGNSAQYLADDCRLVADARQRRLRSTESRTCSACCAASSAAACCRLQHDARWSVVMNIYDRRQAGLTIGIY